MDLFSMPDHTRLWVYQSSRKLNDEEQKTVLLETEQFLDSWSAHGNQMEARAAIYEELFLLIGANEEKALASGCGIDKHVRFVKELGARMGIDFLTRTIVAYKDENGDFIQKPLHEFWAMRKAGLIGDHTLIVNTTVKNLGEWKSVGIQSFKESWHQEMWGR